MDKNTLIGLLLIGAILFGFTICQRDKAEKLAQNNDTVEKVDGKAEKAAADLATPAADSVFAAEISRKVAANGRADGDGSKSLTIGKSLLTVDSLGTLSGTVTVEGKALNVADVLNPASEMTAEQRRAAMAALREDMTNVDRYSQFAGFVGGANDTIHINNGLIDVTFASLGGRVESVVLPGYKTETTDPATDIVLMDPATDSYEFELQTANQRITTGMLNFKAEKVNDSTVVMSLPLSETAQLAIRYTVVPGEYLVKMDLEQKGMQTIIPANQNNMLMRWHQTLRRNETGKTFEERNSTIVYKFDGESPDELDANSNDDDELKGSLKWVAFKNQFFSTALIAKRNMSTADVKSEVVKGPKELKNMSMEASMPYSSLEANPASFACYFGPNDYPLLSDMDHRLAAFAADGEDNPDLQLNKLVNVGWGIFGWINKFVVIPVFSFLSDYISNYGIIILILTLLVKLVLFPLTFKSYMSQAKMRVLAPEIKAINDKYPDQADAMKKQQETMALYSRAGASPFAGCLPMLLQMPILIAMFAFFPSAIELRGESFLWAHDLSAPDFVFTLPFSIPFLGNKLSLFCLLMTVVNILYTRINMQNQPTSSSMPGMKWMMYLMPLMFLFFFNDYASGLSYYYFLSLLITIVQTYIFRLVINEDKVRAEMLANAKKPRKKTGFMARLEEAQKRQEAMMREQQRAQNKRRR